MKAPELQVKFFDHLPGSALLRIAAVASLLGCSVATVRRWERAGLLPEAHILPTRRLAWRVSELRQTLARRSARLGVSQDPDSK